MVVVPELEDGVGTFVHALEHLDEGAVLILDVGDDPEEFLASRVVVDARAAGGVGLVAVVEDVVQGAVDAVLKVSCGLAVEGLLCLGEGDVHLHVSGGFVSVSIVLTGTALGYCEAFANWC